MRASEVRIAAERNTRGGKTGGALGKHVARVVKARFLHFADKGEGDVVVAGRGVAPGNMGRGALGGAVCNAADFIRQGKAEKQAHGRISFAVTLPVL